MLVIIVHLSAIISCNVALTSALKIERVKQMFDRDHYAVTWDKITTYASESELELGFGSAQGQDLNWVRFRPVKNKVEIISISYIAGKYKPGSKRREDRASISVKSARIDNVRYSQLLNDLAVVRSANTRPIGGTVHSTLGYWGSVRLVRSKEILGDFDHCNYWSASTAYLLAKPVVSVALVREVLDRCEFKNYDLSDSDRSWVNRRFCSLWESHKAKDNYYWVCDRAIDMIGYVGNNQSLPVLKNIISDRNQDTHAYSAINAITRLTGKDVRILPPEQMDINATRTRILELLNDMK